MWWDKIIPGDEIAIKAESLVTCGLCGATSWVEFEDTGEYLGLNPLSPTLPIYSFVLDNGVMCPACGDVNEKYGHILRIK
jgi:hypothetical protein